LIKQPILIAAKKEFHPYYHQMSFREETSVVTSLDQATTHLQNSHWDLVLFDCGQNVNEMYTFLGASKTYSPGIPILVLVENGTEDIAVTAFRMGAREYIPKPFEITDLKDRIENLLSVKRLNQPGRDLLPLKCSDTSIDVCRRETDYIPLAVIRAIKYMEENFRKSITLRQLTREIGYSHHYFCRTFKKSMRISPIKFLNQLRVEEAKKLIGRHGLKLSAIAINVGFGNLNNMNKWFRVFEETSPSKYQSRHN
jgi:AraC-like DNA-binding protein